MTKSGKKHKYHVEVIEERAVCIRVEADNEQEARESAIDFYVNDDDLQDEILRDTAIRRTGTHIVTKNPKKDDGVVWDETEEPDGEVDLKRCSPLELARELARLIKEREDCRDMELDFLANHPNRDMWDDDEIKTYDDILMEIADSYEAVKKCMEEISGR